MKPKFNIGDEVWHATTKTREVYDTCLECMGKRYLTVILGDDSQVTIQCECCKRGYMGATGQINRFEHYEEVALRSVGGVEISGDTFEYRLPSGSGGYYCVKESDVFNNQASAELRATKIAAERTKEAMDNSHRKYKQDRSWAWHVKYHREALRRALEQVGYHNEELQYAKSVAKS